MPTAPLASSASPTSAIGNLIAGGQPGQGADQMQQQLQSLASQIRDIGQMVDGIATDFPNAAQEVAAIKGQLKQIIVKAASQAPPATASSQAVPTGATNGPQ